VKSKKKSNFNSNKTYYWYKYKNIISTEGYYYENPLNGLYIKFYSNNNLKEKGSFYYGLKINKWINWDENGKIFSIENYKKGTKKGIQKYFKEGKVYKVEKLNFWRNKTIYSDSTIIHNKLFNTTKVLNTSKLND
jgi:antitoxin component YwqK of YwqJK toxin-antitoxin module